MSGLNYNQWGRKQKKRAQEAASKEDVIREVSKLQKEIPIPLLRPSQGWECSKCRSVYAPFIPECNTCKNSGLNITTMSTVMK